MATGKKTGGRDFKNGNNANPNGRPPLSPEAKEFKSLTTDQYIKLVNKFLHATEDDVLQIVNDCRSTMLEKFVANIVLKGGNFGDINRLEFLLERIIGPVVKKTDLTSGDKPIKSGTIIYLPHNGKEVKKG